MAWKCWDQSERLKQISRVECGGLTPLLTSRFDGSLLLLIAGYRAALA
jgi:hypothetical protein